MRYLKKFVALVIVLQALAALPSSASAYGMSEMIPMYGGMYGMFPMYGMNDSIYQLYSMYGPYGMQGNSMYAIGGMYPMEGYWKDLQKMMYSMYGMYGMFPMQGSMYGMVPMFGMLPRSGMLSMAPLYGMAPMYGGMYGMFPMYGSMDAIYRLYSMYGMRAVDPNQVYLISGPYPMDAYLDYLNKMMHSMYGMFPISNTPVMSASMMM